MQRRERHLGRADQEQVVLARPRRPGRGASGNMPVPTIACSRTSTGGTPGRKPLPVSMSMPQLHQRQLQADQVAQQVVEAAAGHRRGGLDVDQAQSVWAGQARGDPSARTRTRRLWPCVLMVTASSSDMPSAAVGSGRFGMRSISLRMRSVISARAPSSGRLLGLQLGLAGDRDRGVLALLLGLGDRLGRRVVRRACCLDGGLQAAALSVQPQECIDQLAGAAARQRFADAVRLRADQLRVDHDLADTNASRKRATPSCSGPGTVASASSSRT